MSKQSQYDRIEKLISRKKGATPAELIAATMSTSIHRRLFELRQRGWDIRRLPVPGCRYGRYVGTRP